jgi:hypothetical protein
VLNNLTIDLTDSYLDYVASIPNIASSLTSLGRSYHREMNAPVSEAIAGLEESLTTFQTSLLSSELISALAVIRTIRASSTMETAQTAWSRLLNLPGGTGGDDDAAGDPAASSSPRGGLLGRAEAKRPRPKNGLFYTHQELWNTSESVTVKKATKQGVVVRAEERSEPRARQSTMGKSDPHDVVVQKEEQLAMSAEKAKVGRPFVV